MKVHVAWEHSSFKNVDLAAVQSSDPQAQMFNSQILGSYLGRERPKFNMKSDGAKLVSKGQQHILVNLQLLFEPVL
jgi:hypothetical protein